MPAVICEKSDRKVYRTVVRPAGLFGLDTMEVTRRQEAESNMLRFSLGATRTDRRRNEQVGHLETQSEVEMVWTCSEEEQRICW